MEEATLDCKIYLDTSDETQRLTKALADHLGCQAERRTLALNWGEIDIRDNEDYDQERRKAFPDGFLYFSHALEVYATQVPLDKRRNLISNILTFFWGTGISAVAACDYEDMLPLHGGYKSHEIPWPNQHPSGRHLAPAEDTI